MLSQLETEINYFQDPWSLAAMLMSGNCPVNWRARLLIDTTAIAIAKALQSGLCPVGLQINLGNDLYSAAPPQIDLRENELYFDDYQIDEEAGPLVVGWVDMIVEAVKSDKCPVRLTLDLRETGLGNKGAIAFAAAFKSGRCSVGLKLDLRRNNIGDEGARAIIEALKSNYCSDELCLEMMDNPISPGVYKELEEAIKTYADNFLKRAISFIEQQRCASSNITKLPTEALYLILEKAGFGVKTIKKAYDFIDKASHSDEDSLEGLVSTTNLMEINPSNSLEKAISFIQGRYAKSSSISQLDRPLIDFILETAGFRKNTIAEAHEFFRSLSINGQIAQQAAISSKSKPSSVEIPANLGKSSATSPISFFPQAPTPSNNAAETPTDNSQTAAERATPGLFSALGSQNL